MSEIDLSPFCWKDDTRVYLRKPFSDNNHTFATNGHIAVRVAKRNWFGSLPLDCILKIESIHRLFAEAEKCTAFRPLSGLVLPPEPAKETCEYCLGFGKIEEADHSYECDDCDGGYNDAKWSLRVGVVNFNQKYIRLIAGLPGAEFQDAPEPMLMASFRFDGGIGAVMPLRDDCDNRFGDIEQYRAKAEGRS